MATVISEAAPNSTNSPSEAPEFDELGMNVEAMAMADEEVRKAVLDFQEEADSARQTRKKKNRLNKQVYMEEQDYSYKMKGQSTEFIPKVSTAVEIFSAFAKRSLTQFGRWFSVNTGRSSMSPLSGEQLEALLNQQLAKLYISPTQTVDFSQVFGDAIKQGALEAVFVLKSHGVAWQRREFFVEHGEPMYDPAKQETHMPAPELKTRDKLSWSPRIDLVWSEDYFPDPTGNGLYEIHRVERDYHDILAAAQGPDAPYELAQVQKLRQSLDGESESSSVRERQKGQNTTYATRNRRKIELLEFWGTLLDSKGEVIMKNCVCTIANKKFVIRRPEPNPYWHGKSPFDAVAIVRVPMSVWHKALMDAPARLNVAMNEIFNLLVDGGLAAVWGTRQVRHSYLEDPSIISAGIPQGTTLAIKDNTPEGMKVVETVTTGNVPPDAMAMFELVNREFNQAALTNEIRMGGLPSKNVKATEIIQSSQTSAVVLDAIAGTIEIGVAPCLEKTLLNCLQNFDMIPKDDAIAALGIAGWLTLSRMDPATRYAAYSVGQFQTRVFGLSATLAMVRDFQKTVAFLQLVMQNPLMTKSFLQKFSPDKVLMMLMRQLNINPEDIKNTQEEMSLVPERMKDMQAMMAMMQGQGSQPGIQGPGAPTTDQLTSTPDQGGGTGPALPAQIAQEANPLTGMST